MTKKSINSSKKLRELNSRKRKLICIMFDQIIPESIDGRLPSAGSLDTEEFIMKKVEEDQEFAKNFDLGMIKMEQLIRDFVYILI